MSSPPCAPTPPWAVDTPAVDPTRPYEPTGMTTARWQTIRPELIDPRRLVLAQDGVTIHGLLAHALGTATSWSGDPYPHAVEHHGRLHLADGHHRITLALLAGYPAIPTRVLRPPPPGKPS